MTDYLYRVFDDHGGLLYIGVSDAPMRRFGQHHRTAPWADQVAQILVEPFETRSEAEEAERIAIADERPAYNVVHNPQSDPAPAPAQTYAVVHRVESGDPWLDQVLTIIRMMVAFDGGSIGSLARFSAWWSLIANSIQAQLRDGNPKRAIPPVTEDERRAIHAYDRALNDSRGGGANPPEPLYPNLQWWP